MVQIFIRDFSEPIKKLTTQERKALVGEAEYACGVVLYS